MAADYQRFIRQGSYINGRWHDSENRFAVYDKSSGALISNVTNAQPEDMQSAVEHASNAFNDWSALTGAQRSHYLHKWYALIEQNNSTLAALLSREQGKPLHEAQGEIHYGAGYIKWFAEEANRISGDIMDGLNTNQTVHVVKKPVGVVGAITPWNFPHAMIARKAAAALAAGCTFVVRPAAETPLSALALAALAEQAEIPAGVLNVVTGTDARALGQVLTQSTKIAKFSFTGSTAVGRQLIKDCASTIKRVSMELGGNAPFIVFEDADLDAALEGAMLAKFRNAGQTCVCANRFLVHRAVHDDFVAALKNKMANLQQGPGIAHPDIGPLISLQAAKNVHALVEDAQTMGATLQVLNPWSGSTFYPPVVLTGVTDNMRIFNEEIFGPVVAVIAFDTEDDAIRLANQTQYGLAAYLYTQNYSRIARVSSALEFGMVGVNDAAISNPIAPFGGVKQSGYGREGSKYGLDDYLSLQYRCIGIHHHDH